MGEPMYMLSEEDRKVLQMMLDDYKRRYINARNRPRIVEPDPQTPEVYIAAVPSGGIPALVQGNTGTFLDDVPGQATCQIYQILNPTGSAPTVVAGGFSEVVYNMSTTAIPGKKDTWVKISRDKFGSWICDPPLATGSTVGMLIEDSLGTGTWYPGSEIVNVTTLRFDRTTGIFATFFHVTGQADIYIASASPTQAGVIDFGTQQIKGQKQYWGPVTVGNGAAYAAPANVGLMSVGKFRSSGVIEVGYYLTDPTGSYVIFGSPIDQGFNAHVGSVICNGYTAGTYTDGYLGTLVGCLQLDVASMTAPVTALRANGALAVSNGYGLLVYDLTGSSSPTSVGPNIIAIGGKGAGESFINGQVYLKSQQATPNPLSQYLILQVGVSADNASGYAYKQPSGTINYGQNGTGGGGDTISGGLVTALGTGPTSINGGSF